MPSTARSRSASANTAIGFFPPSSRETVFTALLAALAWIRNPVATLPMNAMRRTSGCLTRASPTSPPSPGRIWTTPGGKIRCRSSAMANAVSDVCSDGFMMTVFPASNGATIFDAQNISG